MGIGRLYIRLLLVVGLLTPLIVFAQQRKLDRKKWNELKEEINKRRYDSREVITSRDQTRENRTYQDIEDANRWTSGDKRYQDPDRNSDYSQGDNGDNNTGSGRYGDDNGSDGTQRESNGERDQDIFDDNAGKGNDAEDELGNSTWNDDERGNGNGGSQPDKEDTYRLDPPDREVSSSRSSSYSSSAGISSVWMYIMLGVLVAFILYLLLKSVDWKNKKVNVVTGTGTDKFETLEFTKSELELAIERALAQGNYREAIRIYFLAVIKELKDRELIRWEKKKTNYSYLNEMLAHPHYRRFEFATRIFEVVWYGNRHIGSEEFHSVEPVYKGLLSDISRA